MIKFDSDYAVFATFSAQVEGHPYHAVIRYANPVSSYYFESDIRGLRLVDVLGQMLGTTELAYGLIDDLQLNGSVICEARLEACYVQLHMRYITEKQVLQGAIVDISENRQLREGFYYTVKALARASEANDPDTGEHVLRIDSYCRKMAALIGMGDGYIEDLGMMSQLHDVGKIHIPASILQKPGKLTVDEFEVMKQHTVYGHNIIGPHDKFVIGREVAIGHHEKWDGSGYPHALSGDNISLSARIVAIVDVFDALMSKRSYKRAFSLSETRQIIETSNQNGAEHFDPHLLTLFLGNFDTFVHIHQDQYTEDASDRL